MSIWKYADKGIYPKEYFDASHCIFCQTPLKRISSIPGPSDPTFDGGLYGFVSNQSIEVCPACGWWKARRVSHLGDGARGTRLFEGSAAVLRALNHTADSVAMDEIRAYLSARFGERFSVNPRRFEEVVASIYKDLGYQSLVTSYRGDNGIDVFLEKDGNITGVQVKRTKLAIEAEQIRALTGSLVLGGITRGCFVTTSRFRSGAKNLLDRYEDAGYKLELVDGDAFFELLRLAQIESFSPELAIPEIDAFSTMDRLYLEDSGTSERLLEF